MLTIQHSYRILLLRHHSSTFVGTFILASRWLAWPQGVDINYERSRMTATTELPQKTSTRGFASMDPEKQRAIARKGGESVPHEKRSFSQNPALAAEAGRKGGQSVSPSKRSFSQNHKLASEAGRKGGHASHGGPKAARLRSSTAAE